MSCVTTLAKLMANIFVSKLGITRLLEFDFLKVNQFRLRPNTQSFYLRASYISNAL